jgi:hypothetical protein
MPHRTRTESDLRSSVSNGVLSWRLAPEVDRGDNIFSSVILVSVDNLFMVSLQRKMEGFVRMESNLLPACLYEAFVYSFQAQYAP